MAVPEGSRSVERKRVGVAEYATATEGTLSTSGLGSCVAVAIYEPGGLGGLLHAMLARTSDVPGTAPEKCVDTGIEVLVERLLDAGADRGELVAKLAGGSAMLDLTGPAIGDRNVAVARETLADFGVSILGVDTGGKRGRSVHLSLPEGDFHVRCGDALRTL